jgi:hypothetical protein
MKTGTFISERKMEDPPKEQWIIDTPHLLHGEIPVRDGISFFEGRRKITYT